MSWRDVLSSVGYMSAARPQQKGGPGGPDVESVVRKFRAKTDRSGRSDYKMEKYTIPELVSDTDWLHITGQARAPLKQPFQPIKPKQILLVDVYSSWSGPCAAMEGHLRRLRHQFVATPDCLALAKACSDNITDLEPFKSDPRPTFLIWARGGPVALMRGANRPLLTKLVEQEVEVEVNDGARDPSVEINFKSEKVIQCQGDLALLGDDEVVHSIGSGRTDMLTSFFQDPPKVKKKKKRNLGEDGEEEEIEDEEDEDENVEDATECDEEDGEEEANAAKNGQENEGSKSGKKKAERKRSKNRKKNEGGKPRRSSANSNNEEPEVKPEEAVEEAVTDSVVVGEEGEGENVFEGEQQQQAENEVNGEGVKKSGNKKMETGLLKEILDAKPKKRYGI